MVFCVLLRQLDLDMASLECTFLFRKQTLTQEAQPPTNFSTSSTFEDLRTFSEERTLIPRTIRIVFYCGLLPQTQRLLRPRIIDLIDLFDLFIGSRLLTMQAILVLSHLISPWRTLITGRLF
jgi:hypothetical protein